MKRQTRVQKTSFISSLILKVGNLLNIPFPDEDPPHINMPRYLGENFYDMQEDFPEAYVLNLDEGFLRLCMEIRTAHGTLMLLFERFICIESKFFYDKAPCA